ncbi:hypothetical protein BJ684DRAFT_16339 [Piptocephalis cylindrospora]|uniref:Uncharacterized protein n=1 Tax=Piptocephalis cylindrospora TaxID=1907219 RepID=A0A4P9Y507_9FUNG|nr:hypothetical protein BJ684DRAFT_16339 [Piptocephalis cylindrospora]|eukprot:RKP13251.1 hypothetical protein BJ684DRAFT_16339 [Piptocephalis cylindrospora]
MCPLVSLHTATLGLLGDPDATPTSLSHFFKISPRDLPQKCSTVKNSNEPFDLKDTHLERNDKALRLVLKNLCRSIEPHTTMSYTERFSSLAYTSILRGRAARDHLGIVGTKKSLAMRKEHMKALEELYTDYYSLETLPLLCHPRRLPLIKWISSEGHRKIPIKKEIDQYFSILILISRIESNGIRSRSVFQAFQGKLGISFGRTGEKTGQRLNTWLTFMDNARMLASFLLDYIHTSFPGLLNHTPFSPSKDGKGSDRLREVINGMKVKGSKWIQNWKEMPTSGVKVGGQSSDLKRNLTILAMPILDGLLVLLDLCKKATSLAALLKSIRPHELNSERLKGLVNAVWSENSLTSLNEGMPFGDEKYRHLTAGQRMRLSLSEHQNIPWALVMHRLIDRHAILLWSSSWDEFPQNQQSLAQARGLFHNIMGPSSANHPLITLIVGFSLSLMQLGGKERSWKSLEPWILRGLKILHTLRSRKDDLQAQRAAHAFTHLFGNLESVAQYHPPGYSKGSPISADSDMITPKDLNLKKVVYSAYQTLLYEINRNDASITLSAWNIPHVGSAGWSKKFLGKPFGWSPKEQEEAVEEDDRNEAALYSSMIYV